MDRKLIAGAGLVVAVGVLGLTLYPYVQQHREEQRQKAAGEAIVAQITREKELAARLPRPDLGTQYWPRAHARPQSAWQSAEKQFHASLLAKGRFDVLVVPFQVQDVALSRSLRSLMTAQLSTAIAAAGKKVAEPYLVARALGDGQRQIDLRETMNLANAVGAKTIVLGYVGHIKEQSMRLTLNVYERDERVLFGEGMLPRQSNYTRQMVPVETMKARHFENLALSADATPIDAYQPLLPEILKLLGLDASRYGTRVVSRFEAGDLPGSPFALEGGAAEPARDAYYLQLLAALAPQHADRERERLNEKSMLAVLAMAPESPDYRLLKARGLMQLGLRPAAIKALGEPATAEERHLRAALDGNLPEVRSYRGQIPPGARAFMAALEESAIATAYGEREEQEVARLLASLQLPSGAWQYLATRAFRDRDLWAQFQNIELKALLDKDLPVEGFTAEAMLRGAAVVGDASKLETAADLSVLDHARKHVQTAAAQWCCRAPLARPGQAEVLDLVEAVATDNLVRRGRFFVSVQGSPESALRFLGAIEGAYKDHPGLAVVRGQAEIAVSRRSSGTERDGLLRSAFVSGMNAWYWEQGQTHTAARAFSDVVAPAQQPDYGRINNYFAGEYPSRPFYSFWQDGGNLESILRNARAALDNSSSDFSPVRELTSSLGELQKKWDEVDALLASLGSRFTGHPERTTLMAQASLRRGDTKTAQQYYREAIKAQPAARDLYAELGKLLFENGANEGSANVVMSYPGLKKFEANPVAVANYAYEAGSLYYWSGDFSRAIPLYKIAAGLRTGAESSMASEIRLALLNGDYHSAMRGSIERGSRYKSASAYRDYLSLLHALGYSKQGWEGFQAVVGQIDRPQTWEAALTGHHAAGASEAEIAAWAAQEPFRNAGSWVAYAPLHMLRAAVTDRTPSADFVARLAAIERPVWQLQNQYRSAVRASGDGTYHVVLGRESPEEGTLPRGMFEQTQKTRVKSDLVYYAEAYGAIRAGKFDAARTALEEAAAIYDLRNVQVGYLLPAYAYAAARSRDTAAIEKALDAFPEKYRRFDYHLARGITAGLAGKADAALEHLNLAVHRRPFTERRGVPTEYQYAEVCEWLFEATRDARYRRLAVDWAKKNQAVQPWAAWAYAVEAKFASNPADRGRAIAMAYYLDRRSERLAALPKGEVSNAVRDYANRNPFKRALDRAPKQPA